MERCSKNDEISKELANLKNIVACKNNQIDEQSVMLDKQQKRITEYGRELLAIKEQQQGAKCVKVQASEL